MDRAPAGGIRIGGKTYKGGQRIPKRYRAQLEQSSRPQDPAQGIQLAPPNFGRSVIPHVVTFSGLFQTLSRSYRNHDEAIRHSVENAHMILNDPTISGPLFARQRMVALLNWSVVSENDKDPKLKAVADDIQRVLEMTPRFTEYRRWLGEAIWYGRCATMNQFGWHVDRSRKWSAMLKGWVPISGDKLVFRYDDGKAKFDPNGVGIKVSPAHINLDILAGKHEIEWFTEGTAVFLEGWERQRITLHKHMIRDGEYEQPETGGQIHGVGIRNFLYWVWYQKQETLAQLMEIIERTGLGFTIYFYPMGNAKAQAEAEAVATKQSHTNAITMPYDPAMPAAPTIEQIPPNTAGVQVLIEVVDRYFGDVITKFILGQTLSTRADATGLGSGVADLHQDSLAQIVKYDAINLEETLTRELVWKLRDWNHPKFRNYDFQFKISTDSKIPQEELAAIYNLWNMGAEFKTADVMEKVGMSMPKEDDEKLFNPGIKMQMQQAMQPQMPPGMPGQDPGMGGPDQGPPPDEPPPDQGGGDEQSEEERQANIQKLFGPILNERDGAPIRYASGFQPRLFDTTDYKGPKQFKPRGINTQRNLGAAGKNAGTLWKVGDRQVVAGVTYELRTGPTGANRWHVVEASGQGGQKGLFDEPEHPQATVKENLTVEEKPDQTLDTSAEVPRKSNDPDFDYDQAVKIAADDISTLRKSDVYRVLTSSPEEHREGLNAYIQDHRPDLAEESEEVMQELHQEWRQAQARKHGDKAPEPATTKQKGLLGEDYEPTKPTAADRAHGEQIKPTGKDLTKPGKQQAMFDTKGDPDQNLLFDTDAPPLFEKKTTVPTTQKEAINQSSLRLGGGKEYLAMTPEKQEIAEKVIAAKSRSEIEAIIGKENTDRYYRWLTGGSSKITSLTNAMKWKTHATEAEASEPSPKSQDKPTDIPDKTPDKKEPTQIPHEMTIAEYKERRGDNPKAIAFHRKEVRNALATGKPVPPEVLADYPDLQPTGKTDPFTEYNSAVKDHSGDQPSQQRLWDATKNIEQHLRDSGVDVDKWKAEYRSAKGGAGKKAVIKSALQEWKKTGNVSGMAVADILANKPYEGVTDSPQPQHTKPATVEEAIDKVRDMVRQIARKYPSHDQDDLEQEGLIGVMRAWEKYDPSKGASFVTYAHQWISSKIQHAAKKADRSQGAGLEYDPEAPQPAAGIDEETKDQVHQTLAKLAPEQRELIEHVFGLDQGEGMSEAEYGREKGLSRQAINKRKSQALEAFKEKMGQKTLFSKSGIVIRYGAAFPQPEQPEQPPQNASSAAPSPQPSSAPAPAASQPAAPAPKPATSSAPPANPAPKPQQPAPQPTQQPAPQAQQPQENLWHHAPAGGMKIGDRQYRPGEAVPHDVWSGMSKEDRRQLRGSKPHQITSLAEVPEGTEIEAPRGGTFSRTAQGTWTRDDGYTVDDQGLARITHNGSLRDLEQDFINNINPYLEHAHKSDQTPIHEDIHDILSDLKASGAKMTDFTMQKALTDAGISLDMGDDEGFEKAKAVVDKFRESNSQPAQQQPANPQQPAPQPAASQKPQQPAQKPAQQPYGAPQQSAMTPEQHQASKHLASMGDGAKIGDWTKTLDRKSGIGVWFDSQGGRATDQEMARMHPADQIKSAYDAATATGDAKGSAGLSDDHKQFISDVAGSFGHNAKGNVGPNHFVRTAAKALGYDPQGKDLAEQTHDAAKFLDSRSQHLDDLIGLGQSLGWNPKLSQAGSLQGKAAQAKGAATKILQTAIKNGWQPTAPLDEVHNAIMNGNSDSIKPLKDSLESAITYNYDNSHGLGNLADGFKKIVDKLGGKKNLAIIAGVLAATLFAHYAMNRIGGKYR